MNGQTHLRQIVKRTGEIAPFSPEKIEQAIFKAMRASGVPNRKEARRLCSEVVASLEKTAPNRRRTSNRCRTPSNRRCTVAAISRC
ncbi:MAG: ATP cone domain-containing protein [Alistipes sp.]